MFGYVKLSADATKGEKGIFQTFMCGVCLATKDYSQKARTAVGNDITFLNVLFHSVLEQEVQVEKGRCVSHPITPRPLMKVDEICQKLATANVLLTYLSLDDHAKDEGNFAKKIAKKAFQKDYEKACQRERLLADKLSLECVELARLEEGEATSLDQVCHKSAQLLVHICHSVFGQDCNKFLQDLCYNVGKWVYLIDALDDYDKDKKKGAYNPFLLAYQAECRADLLRGQSGEEVQYAFHSLFFDIRQNLSKLQFKFNRDLSDNILLRGLPMMTKRIMEGKGCDCKRDKTPQITDNIGK